MRSLIIRFHPAEGPGLLGDILQEKESAITYHNAYESGLSLIPQAHQMFDRIILLGGPQSIAGKSSSNGLSSKSFSSKGYDRFFDPYIDLVQNASLKENVKTIGVCLGSQIIAKALGGDVGRGDKGSEVGFERLEIKSPEDWIFQDLTDKSGVMGFHLHEDIFFLPPKARLLLSSGKYSNQMFAIENRIYGIQAHLEPSWNMLKSWVGVHSEFLGLDVVPEDWKEKQETMESTARSIFRRIIEN